MCLAEYAGHLRGDGKHDIEIDLGMEGAGSGLFISEFWQTVQVVKTIHGTCQFILLYYYGNTENLG
jgi:hypothetical protein